MSSSKDSVSNYRESVQCRWKGLNQRIPVVQLIKSKERGFSSHKESTVVCAGVKKIQRERENNPEYFSEEDPGNEKAEHAEAWLGGPA